MHIFLHANDCGPRGAGLEYEVKFITAIRRRQAMPESQAKPSRRGFLWGAAATGAAAATVAALPKVEQAAQAPIPETAPPPERGGGYRLSEHVKQYYQTTRI
jgi:hypothetical protein